LGTGDLSEAALGWCTFNGDHMSMYHVNIGVPKTLVRYLIDWCADEEFAGVPGELLYDIAATPISPELLPVDRRGRQGQKTEDTLGPYELHDYFLYHFVRFGHRPLKIIYLAGLAFAGRYDSRSIVFWLRVFLQRFFSQQFKRSAMPDGPKVGTVALSSRGDWRMPSDAESRQWTFELKQAALQAWRPKSIRKNILNDPLKKLRANLTARSASSSN
jgi:NAD+ synthase (glutamine-hydrolysing)